MTTCTRCKSEFEILKEDLKLLDKLSPIINGIKYDLPPPIDCPDCRSQTRLSFGNNWSYYNRVCSTSKTPIISIHHPEREYPVISQESWWSDEWDPCEHGQEYDFSKTFTEQFKELQQKVPTIALMNSNSINCKYTHCAADNKNCYLITECSNNEDCYYGHWLQQCKKCVDCV